MSMWEELCRAPVVVALHVRPETLAKLRADVPPPRIVGELLGPAVTCFSGVRVEVAAWMPEFAEYAAEMSDGSSVYIDAAGNERLRLPAQELDRHVDAVLYACGARKRFAPNPAPTRARSGGEDADS